MRHIINGQVVEIPTHNGSIQTDDLWEAANIPADRDSILQRPDGSNQLINRGENLKLSLEEFVRQAPKHDRGTTAIDWR